MGTAEKEQRRRVSRKATIPRVIRIELKDGMGNPRWVTADLVDTSERGIGISLMTQLSVGSRIIVRGNLGPERADVLPARVNWCVAASNGAFRAGLEFADSKSSFADGQQQSASTDPSDQDWYEVMQLSPNADAETIGRVYRILAQRYHPDNGQTGNRELFVQLTEAYRVLSDPERRASYDAQHRQTKRLHWNIFDQAQAATGLEAEKRKRQGILSLLHAKTMHDPDHGDMTIRAFEELLGCPREHLQTALWYLKGKGLIQLMDNGRYRITVQGFDEAEQHSAAPRWTSHALLKSGKGAAN